MLSIRFPDFSGQGARATAALLLTVVVSACDALSTDIENPNVVVQDDIEKPAAAAALVGGTLIYATDAMAQLAAAHGTVSDELTWKGSFDVIGAFDRGELQHNDNLYSTDGYDALTVGRWMADETVRILEQHLANNELSDVTLLAQAYWLSGFQRALGGEVFEAFAVSDRQDAGPVVGRGELFQTGIDNLGQAATIAQQEGDSDLQIRALAYQARFHWARALWQKCSSAGCNTADPLVDDAQANTIATQVLASVTDDWQHVFTYSPSTQQSEIGFEVNSRREVSIEDHVIQQSSDERQSCWPGGAACTTDGIRLMDPIDNIQDPALRREAWTFLGAFVYPDNVGVSARELRLILAEAALSNNDMNGFATHINAVRALESSLTPFDPGNPAHVAIAQDLLIHMRQTNLFLQVNRRLMDLYRFGIVAPVWQAGELALAQPGTVFPLGKSECVSNPEIDIAGLCN